MVSTVSNKGMNCMLPQPLLPRCLYDGVVGMLASFWIPQLRIQRATGDEGTPEGGVLLVHTHKDAGCGAEGQVGGEAGDLLAQAHCARPRLRALSACLLPILVVACNALQESQLRQISIQLSASYLLTCKLQL